MAKHKMYCVVARFIHPHKDCAGEYFDNLTYDEAAAIFRVWQKDKIHKDVHIIGAEEKMRSRGNVLWE